jgi:hypothetical protein
LLAVAGTSSIKETLGDSLPGGKQRFDGESRISASVVEKPNREDFHNQRNK